MTEFELEIVRRLMARGIGHRLRRLALRAPKSAVPICRTHSSISRVRIPVDPQIKKGPCGALFDLAEREGFEPSKGY